MENAVMVLQSILFMKLVNDSPVLSGNMQMSISCGLTSPKESEIVIAAPYYDLKEWTRNRVIKRTGESKNGKTDYAYYVNLLGGFATHNKSEKWVNRTIYEVVSSFANELSATVINKLPL